MKAMNQKPELKEGQACMDETVELNANEVQTVSGGLQGFSDAIRNIQFPPSFSPFPQRKTFWDVMNAMYRR